VSLFVRHEFSRKEDNKLNFKFYMTKVVARIYRTVLRVLCFGGWITDFGATGISRCFGT
jgi:hypothetical protein